MQVFYRFSLLATGSSDFLARLTPEVVVLFSKLLIEPVVDGRVADVVDEDEVVPAVVESQCENEVHGDERQHEADGHRKEHLDDQQVSRPLPLLLGLSLHLAFDCAAPEKKI